MADPQPLDGLRVLAAADRPAGAVCAELLRSLGAAIVRDGEAEIVLTVPGAHHAIDAHRVIRCDISAAGAGNAAELPDGAGDLLLQAWGGMMATTGRADGPPRVTGIPLIEIFAGINAATASLGARRLVEGGGPAQPVDAALVDASAGLLGTFVAHVARGKGEGFRDGCRHPICAPWNAYPTRDGQVMLCSSSDAQWHKLLALMGVSAAGRDARFADMAARVRNVGAVDALVGAWTAARTTDAAAEALSAAGIPAGPIRASAALIAGPLASLVETGAAGRRCVSPLRLFPGAPGPLPAEAAGPLPLSGIRVLEIGPFTAGPLAGRLLADLGADVVKVEPPGGEVSRRWTPRFGGESGYFANYNAGKRSVALDLAAPDDQAIFEQLLGAADVVVQNLKTGALAKLGFGPAATMDRHPGLVFCSISGYGAAGRQDPALDTVIQAASGVMALVEPDDQPCKVGFSVADLLAGYLAPLGVLAALRQRSRTGRGSHIDLSMLHALFWSTQSAWDGPAIGPFCRVRGADGWVVAAAEEGAVNDRLGALAPSVSAAAEIVARLAGGDIAAARVRELGEVMADPLLARRGMVRRIPAPDGTPITILGAPYGLAATPPRTGSMIGPVDGDRAAVLRDWLPDAPPDGGVSAPKREMLV